MKTAITELKEQLDRSGIKLDSTLFEKYLEKEKLQIIEAYIEGHTTMQGAGCSRTYYENTFKNDEIN